MFGTASLKSYPLQWLKLMKWETSGGEAVPIGRFGRNLRLEKLGFMVQQACGLRLKDHFYFENLLFCMTSNDVNSSHLVEVKKKGICLVFG